MRFSGGSCLGNESESLRHSQSGAASILSKNPHFYFSLIFHTPITGFWPLFQVYGHAHEASLTRQTVQLDKFGNVIFT